MKRKLFDYVIRNAGRVYGQTQKNRIYAPYIFFGMFDGVSEMKFYLGLKL